LTAVGLLLAVGQHRPLSGEAERQGGEAMQEQTPFRSFALYVLSRGKGVPDEAWEALGKVRAVAETNREKGIAVTIQEKRIGLEGERRLCIEYEEEEKARRTYDRAKALVEGVDLARLEIETCAEPEEDEKEKGEEP